MVNCVSWEESFAMIRGCFTGLCFEAADQVENGFDVMVGMEMRITRVQSTESSEPRKQRRGVTWKSPKFKNT
jgi:hypothetical protein